MKLRLTLLALISAVALRAASDVPVFNAILAMGKEHRFVLVSPTGKASSWLKLGDTFEAYKLTAYEAKDAALDLERDGKVVRVTLVSDAAIGSAPLLPTPATLADAEATLKAMNFERMMERILAGATKNQGKMVEQMMAGLKQPGVDMNAVVAIQKKVMDEMMAAIGGPELTKDMTRIYSEVFTKEELQGLAAFYSTPLGQSLNDKTPEVQEKMSAAMMPRMMAVMPKVQQIMKDFAVEQRAKSGKAPGGAPPAPKP